MCTKLAIFKSILNIQTNNLSSSFFVSSRSRFQRLLFIRSANDCQKFSQFKGRCIYHRESFNKFFQKRYHIYIVLVLLRPLMDQRTIVNGCRLDRCRFHFNSTGILRSRVSSRKF